MEGLTSAVCLTCGTAFEYHADFYATRALKPPRRCRHCRERKRATEPTGPTLTGTVARVCTDFAFLAGGDGRRYFAHATSVAGWPLATGDAVRFVPAADVTDYETPGRCPRAYVVQRLEGTDAE